MAGKKKQVSAKKRVDGKPIVGKNVIKRAKKKTGPKPGQKQKPKCHAGEWIPVFLTWLGKTGNIRLACDKAGITRIGAYKRREIDPEFKEQWDQAKENALDDLEKIAWKRAKKSSDTLMIFLLKAHRGYRDRTAMELTGANGGPIDVINSTVENQRTFLLSVMDSIAKQLENANPTSQEIELPLIAGEMEDAN